MCNCVEQMNDFLDKEQYNTHLDVALTFSPKTGRFEFQGVKVATTKANNNNKRKPIPVVASYCPFCGEKYKNEN